jgi:hypothetical protein
MPKQGWEFCDNCQIFGPRGGGKCIGDREFGPERAAKTMSGPWVKWHARER